MRYKVIAMEAYVARDERMVDRVLRDVAEDCDIYIGIFAWRYGYIPPQENPKAIVTELEYREAEAEAEAAP